MKSKKSGTTGREQEGERERERERGDAACSSIKLEEIEA